MRYYHNLFAYLNGKVASEGKVLEGKNRPVLEVEGSISHHPDLINRGGGVYEIGFPYLTPEDWQHHHQQLQQEIIFSLDNAHHSLSVTDEVMDSGAIEDEEELQTWQREGRQHLLDDSVALLLQNFNELLKRGRKEEGIYLYELLSYLKNFSIAEASLPLILSLERRYELAVKLRQITPKLRHQLRRQAESIPIGRIQEMDSYCLRDYTRRPGNTPEEKAGSRGELMGIQRYQDYNTVENKFLVYFAAKLHLEGFRYLEAGNHSYTDSVKKFLQTIDVFRGDWIVRSINSRNFQFTRPNYVLLQNPIYSSFYRAYLDYVAGRSEKQGVWSGRNRLLGNVVYLSLLAAILNFNGVTHPVDVYIPIKSSPDYGDYLPRDNPVKTRVTIFLRRWVYEIEVSKSSDYREGDYLLNIERQDSHSLALESEEYKLPIWVFWYGPSEEVIASALTYMEARKDIYRLGLIFSLGAGEGEVNPISPCLWWCEMPLPNGERGFLDGVNFFSVKVIKNLLEFLYGG